jgi:antitoxin component YwqK of YwqJK toxin-antitoxin module
VLEGENCVEYDEDGQCVYKGIMKGGKYHGTGYRYYPEDVLKFEGEFDKGRYTTGKEFREDGTLRYEGEYNKDRKFQGVGTFYFRGGAIKEKGAYQNGKLHGDGCEEYREGGGLRYTGGYERGKRNGLGISYYENGNKKYEGCFKEDKCQDDAGTEYKEDGTLHYKGAFQKGNWEGTGARYYEDGSVLFTGEFREGRRYKGQEFRRDGILRYEGLYRDGQYEGEGNYYGREGELKWEGDFIDGLIDCDGGKQYFKNGTIEYEGEFQAGKPEGFGKQFDTEGGAIREGYFTDGKYYGKKPPKDAEKKERVPRGEGSEERRMKRSATPDVSPMIHRRKSHNFDALKVEMNAEIETPSYWSNMCATRPSWTGWFEQADAKTDMFFECMQLCNDGTVYGEGSDAVGSFTLNGTIGDAAEVSFVKQYEGAHAVNYSGQCIGATISGNWDIPDNCGGTFELNLSSDYVENWTGWFEQSGTNTDMALDIHIDETGVFGMGADPVGTFMVRGIYDMSSGKVNFIKKYLGAHEVLYRGKLRFTDGVYTVAGDWEIIDNCGGTFELRKEGGIEIQ